MYFNVKFNVFLKLIKVHLLVSELNIHSPSVIKTTFNLMLYREMFVVRSENNAKRISPLCG